jgi:uncharacterized protein (TIGR01777 family)
MRVLVTGASGLIGTKLSAALAARGDEVVGLTRDPAKSSAKQPEVTWHAWEPTLERPPAAAFEGVDAVVNLVGEPISQRWTEDAKTRIMESRRTGTHNLVGAIAGLERKPAVLVSGSAVGYYGDRGDALVDESTGAGSTFEAQVSVAWEKAVDELDTHGVRMAIVRTGLVLDPSAGLLGELMTPFKLGVGGPIAGGKNYMPWIHIDDEVGILLWALDNESVSGIVNGTAPNPATNKEFTKALGKALGRPAVLPLPGFVLDLKFGGEFGKVLRGGQKAVPRRTQELGYTFKFPELDAALRDLV